MEAHAGQHCGIHRENLGGINDFKPLAHHEDLTTRNSKLRRNELEEPDLRMVEICFKKVVLKLTLETLCAMNGLDLQSWFEYLDHRQHHDCRVLLPRLWETLSAKLICIPISVSIVSSGVKEEINMYGIQRVACRVGETDLYFVYFQWWSIACEP